MTRNPAFHGFGLGLRSQHYPDFLEHDVAVDFVEVISENFMIAGGRPLHILERIRERHPVALHGVSMSIGSADGLDQDHLMRLKSLVDRIDPLFVSDHLCWTAIEGFNSHDLLPIPYTREAMDVVCANVAQAQDMLGRAMLIENPSSYVRFADSDATEWDFMAEMCARTGCDLLLDVNNIFVSATNHGFDAIAYLDGVPAERVRQIHLAGHSSSSGSSSGGGRDLLIDTHDRPVPDSVWALYDAALARIGPVATMIERDDDIPPLADLLAELDQARRIAAARERIAA
ncbi:MNIO family bufferin maturase [Sphingomonas sp.]|uniref:MNIO family bufferin maturase n=1 Tax=Sphingomonas sp. TaxID=28214 RepID=UPI003D6D2EC5